MGKTGKEKKHFKSFRFASQKLKVLAKSQPQPSGIIFQLNYPLTPILQAAANASKEAGIKNALLKEWEGASILQNAEVQTMVLTNGQVLLVFSMILSTFGCSMLILLCLVNHSSE